MSEIVNVPFYGQNLVAVEKNGRIYVAMKPIVEAIGLEWNKQLISSTCCGTLSMDNTSGVPIRSEMQAKNSSDCFNGSMDRSFSPFHQNSGRYFPPDYFYPITEL